MPCFACESGNTELILDLGLMPIANNFLDNPEDDEELLSPLEVEFCVNCKLVQLNHSLSRELIFNNNYPYFSGVSKSWKKHCDDLASLAQSKANLDSKSMVIEIASNDGTLLSSFKKLGIKSVGIEPTLGPSLVANENGLTTLAAYFDSKLAASIGVEFGLADYIVANNVYAHLSELQDFTQGIVDLLKLDGCISIEIAYLLDLVEKGAFDTVYHEHFSYFSITFAIDFFRKFGLRIFEVERLKTHGGSLRLWLCREEARYLTDNSVGSLLEKEKSFGLDDPKELSKMQVVAYKKRNEVQAFFEDKRAVHSHIAGFGAPAKGNTFLNYCQIKSPEIKYLVDGSIAKQGKFAPGSRIPVLPKTQLLLEPVDSIIVLPWNIVDEAVDEIKNKFDLKSEIVVFFPSYSVF